MNHSYEIGENEAKLKNYTIFSNIEILEEAINKSKQVSFKYTRYGVDDNLKLELKNQIKKIVGKETIWLIPTKLFQQMEDIILYVIMINMTIYNIID